MAVYIIYLSPMQKDSCCYPYKKSTFRDTGQTADTVICVNTVTTARARTCASASTGARARAVCLGHIGSP